MSLERTIQLFEAIGGVFTTPPHTIVENLKKVKAFLFDWDGVFNTGYKGLTVGSPYAEADAMGTNLLRFTYWLQYGTLPFAAIITGQNNQAAFELAKREHFQAVYYGIKHKVEALQHLQANYQITPSQVAFSFDDVLDLSAADVVGLRFLIRRQASPLFMQYVKDKHLCDYITGSEGGAYGVREVCELLTGLQGMYEEVVTQRVAYQAAYQNYLSQRDQPTTHFYTYQNGTIVAKEPS
ncbi:MAG: phosphatase [Thermonemataceae bacterium]